MPRYRAMIVVDSAMHVRVAQEQKLNWAVVSSAAKYAKPQNIAVYCAHKAINRCTIEFAVRASMVP